MKIQSVFDPAFARYGKVIEGLDTTALIAALEANTEQPEDAVIYVPSSSVLEATDLYPILRDNVYGGMPIQIGYCNGSNTKLNCVEYHRDSEINIPAHDMIFLVAGESDLVDGHLDTAKIEAFRAPGGAAVELYATTLHYAPCNSVAGQGFRVAVVLPKGTNTDKPAMTNCTPEDALLWARNKWLIAHPDTTEAADGAFVGLDGENPDIADLI